MMECTSCFSPLPAGARFCASCGAPAPIASAEPRDQLLELLRVAVGRQYEIVRLLGRGGMGAVYLAREVSLDREVAIKVLPSHHEQTAQSRERFRREARTAARLSHPNIVPLYTFGEVEGTLYFVMGYVRGESLAALLKREGRLEFSRARRILDDVAQALEYAHAAGVVHRDIKPDNVLIEEGSGRAILTDFGVAKPLDAGETLTLDGSLIGTPHYMSPEQASGRTDVDHRSDLYSLGVMGYAMLAGRLPFQGKTTSELILQHVTAEPPSLKALAPDVPVELNTTLTRCLAKEPERRWFSAADFRAGLAPPAEDEFPAAIHDLREIAAGSILLPLAFAYLLIWLIFSQSDPERIYVALFIGALGLVAPLSVIPIKCRALRKAGYDWRRIAKETFTKPKRWIGWFPRRLRVKGDVWDRLPAEVRRSRSLLSAFIVTTFGLALPLFLGVMARANQPGERPFPMWTLPLLILPVMPLFYGAFIQLRWRKKLRAAGLYDAEVAAQVAVAPTEPSPFWSKPAVARLLAPPAPGERRVSAAAPETPAELLVAISTIVSALDFPARELAERARLAARRVATSIEALDSEIGSLAARPNLQEGERLRAKLTSIGPDDATARINVRSLIVEQLALAERFESRLNEAVQQRAARVELLRTLWLQVSALSAAEAANRDTDTVSRVLALCDEMATYANSDARTEHGSTTRIADAPTLLQ